MLPRYPSSLPIWSALPNADPIAVQSAPVLGRRGAFWGMGRGGIEAELGLRAHDRNLNLTWAVCAAAQHHPPAPFRRPRRR